MGLRMPKVAKVLCVHCDKKMETGESFCPHCKEPTQWATHDERVQWELANYRKLSAVPIEPAKPAAATTVKRAAKRASEPTTVRSAVAEPRVHVTTTATPARVARPKKPRVAPTPAPDVVVDRVVVLDPVESDVPSTPTPAASPTVRKRASTRSPKPVEAAPKPVEPASEQPPKPIEALAPKKRASRKPVAAVASPSVEVSQHPASLELMQEQVQIMRDVLTRVTAIEEHLSASVRSDVPAEESVKRRRLRRR